MAIQKSVFSDTGAEFNALLHTYNVCLQKTLSKYGLYPGQPQVLFAIKEMCGPTQNELADRLNVSKASAGVSLRRLEAAGFVKRARDKADTRCIRITLTQKGQEYARWCEIDFDVLYSTLLESFTGDEREEALGYIRRMNKNLSAFKARLES